MSTEVELVIADVIEAHEGEIGSHWVGCHKFHAGCLAVKLRDMLTEYTHVKQAEAWERGHAAFEQAWESDNRFPYDYATDNPYRKEKNDD